jgi:hypothetical protein
MKTLAELTDTLDPAITLVRKWAAASPHPCEILQPSETRDQTLLAVQVTTHSVLGSIAYETGGVLVDHGWLRLLGAGHPRLTRSLPSWNEGRARGFYLVADDVVGGFFALNGGGLGSDFRKVFYFAPDTLRWESTDLEFSQFVLWSMTEKLQGYYESFRWSSWREDIKALHGDQTLFVFPPLWTKERDLESGYREPFTAAECWDLQMDFVAQLDGPATTTEPQKHGDTEKRP